MLDVPAPGVTRSSDTSGRPTIIAAQDGPPGARVGASGGVCRSAVAARDVPAISFAIAKKLVPHVPVRDRIIEPDELDHLRPIHALTQGALGREAYTRIKFGKEELDGHTEGVGHR